MTAQLTAQPARSAPSYPTVRGIIVGLVVAMVASWNLWAGAGLALAELAYFGYLARDPHLRPFCRRVLGAAALFCVVFAIPAVLSRLLG